jgi:hypothetical protein
MSEKLWDKFELAKEKLNDANVEIYRQSMILVENFKMPKRVIIGEFWLDEYPDMGAIKCWRIGLFDCNCEVEIISGDTIEVIGE